MKSKGTKNKFTEILYRLNAARRVLFGKRFVVHADNYKTYVCGMSMNQLIEAHNGLSVFLNNLMQTAAEQESVLKQARDIIENKN